MQSKQHRPATQWSTVSPVQQTLWHRLPPNSQQQLAHLVAELMEPHPKSSKRQGAGA